MALTPEDVSNKRFTTVRLREGYDMTEVDQFLDEIEAELRRIGSENSELQARNGAAVPVGAGAAAAKSTDVAAERKPAPEAGPEKEEPPARPVATVPEQPSIKVTTTAEASAAATRLLELAGRNADELVLEARQQADQLTSDAKTQADKLTGDAKAQAEKLVADAKERASAMDTETTERRRSVLGAIEREKAGLDEQITKLRTFEREYRAELRTYFEEQLAALDGDNAGGLLAARAGEADGRDRAEG